MGPPARILVSSADTLEIGRLCSLVADTAEVGERISTVSAEWLGRPYVLNSLDPRGPTESLRIDLQAFDCVTMVETALAISLSEDFQQFVDALRGIRYQNGVVAWESRNHYMTDWVTNNLSSGVIQNLTTGAATMEKITVLDAVEGLLPKLTAFRYFPQEKLGSVRRRLQTGDIACFASLKPGLDVFHTGFILMAGGEVVLRHASRSSAMVLDQDLDQFVSANKMLGVIFVRPVLSRRV